MFSISVQAQKPCFQDTVNPTGFISDIETWRIYAKTHNRVLKGFRNYKVWGITQKDQEDMPLTTPGIISKMNEGYRVSVTITNGAPELHAVVIKSITERVITKLNGSSRTKMIYTVMHPCSPGSFKSIVVKDSTIKLPETFYNIFLIK